jgi:hypothetical protein
MAKWFSMMIQMIKVLEVARIRSESKTPKETFSMRMHLKAKEVEVNVMMERATTRTEI